MLCPNCQNQGRRFGRTRTGMQRFQCLPCSSTYSEQPTRLLNDLTLAPAKALSVLSMLLEGCSVRSIERLTQVHRDTILNQLVAAGQKCAVFLDRRLQGLNVQEVQADEIWSFVHYKEKTRQRLHPTTEGIGDAWCYLATERNSKLVVAWHLGSRSPADTREFAEKLKTATNGRFMLSTDGYRPYLNTIRETFGETIDYGQIVKVYGVTDDDHRYSPPTVVSVNKVVLIGDPDQARICTSHAERNNLTIRMQIRRLTRLTNAFSKSFANHRAALALHFGHYNFCRRHMTIKKTPAMEVGLTDHQWSLEELLRAG
jgi:IS1 family transposase/transposase-like protein